MNVLLLNPLPLYRHWPDDQLVGEQLLKFPVLTYVTLAGSVDHPCEFLDGAMVGNGLEALTRKLRWADVVALGVNSKTVALNAELNIRLIKELAPGKRVILGGHHPTFWHREWLGRGADVVVRGEGEITFSDLLDALEQSRDLREIDGISFRKDGELIVCRDRPLVADLDELPPPRFEMIDFDLYDFFAGRKGRACTIETSRGCPHACGFCAVSVMWGQTQRYKSVGRVMRELRALKGLGITKLGVIDDNFGADPERDGELVEAMAREDLDMTWCTNIRADSVLAAPELFRKAAGCGLSFVFIGYEAMSPSLWEKMRKGYDSKQRVEDLIQVFELLDGLDIFVAGLFVVGYPGEVMSEIKETFKHARKVCHDAIIQIFKPIYGTPGYREVAEKRLLVKDMFHHDSRSVSVVGQHDRLATTYRLHRLLFFLNPLNVLKLFFGPPVSKGYYRAMYYGVLRGLLKFSVRRAVDLFYLLKYGGKAETVQLYDRKILERYRDPGFIKRLVGRARP